MQVKDGKDGGPVRKPDVFGSLAWLNLTTLSKRRKKAELSVQGADQNCVLEKMWVIVLDLIYKMVPYLPDLDKN
jgi:hypothetical protein